MALSSDGMHEKGFQKNGATALPALGRNEADEREDAMSIQNPVFIPGPTNMPEVLRKACDMPTIDHRSPLFGAMLAPCLDGVRRVLKAERAQGGIARQGLLIPDVVEMSPEEAERLVAAAPDLDRLGLAIERPC